MRRATSTLVVAVLVVGLALSMFISTFAASHRRSSTSVLNIQNLIEYTDLHEVTKLAILVLGNEVAIRNLGSSSVELEYLVVYVPEGVRVLKIPENGSRILAPDGEYRLTLVRGVVLAAITTRGVVVYPMRAEVRAPPPEAALIIPVTFDLKHTHQMTSEFEVDPQLIVKPYPGNTGKRGMSGSRVFILPPGKEYFNDRISTTCPGNKDNRVPFGVLVVSYDPSWIAENRLNPGKQPRYSILIAGPKFKGQEKLCLSRGGTLPLTDHGFRVKISNFTGTLMIYDSSGRVVACTSSQTNVCGTHRPALGTWYFGVDLGWYVYLDGAASYIGYYQRDPSGQGQPSSYEPYLHIGDIDGNGLVDVLFITEDAYYGSLSKINDSGDEDLSDWSTEPIKLKLIKVGRELGSADGSIDGSKYAGVVLYLNLVFHDNSYPDVDQLEDVDRTDWVLRILLVNERGDELIIREYRYQEICNYHKTLISTPGEDNYFTKLSQSIFISIPSSGKYWVVVAFQDPYMYTRYSSNYINDADMTIGIEIIGVLPLSR